MGKQIWRRRRFLKWKYDQDNWNMDIEAVKAPSGSRRATFMATTALFTDKDLTEELTTCYERFLVFDLRFVCVLLSFCAHVRFQESVLMNVESSSISRLSQSVLVYISSCGSAAATPSVLRYRPVLSYEVHEEGRSCLVSCLHIAVRDRISNSEAV